MPTQLLTEWILGPFSPGVKQPEHEADCSLPSNAEYNCEWSYTPTPHTSLWGYA
jgi:hypothetical protein